MVTFIQTKIVRCSCLGSFLSVFSNCCTHILTPVSPSPFVLQRNSKWPLGDRFHGPANSN